MRLEVLWETGWGVREHKYVGVIVNDVGDWSAQIDRVIKKARKATATLTNTVFRYVASDCGFEHAVRKRSMAGPNKGRECLFEAIQLGTMKIFLTINMSTTTAF